MAMKYRIIGLIVCIVFVVRYGVDWFEKGTVSWMLWFWLAALVIKVFWVLKGLEPEGQARPQGQKDG